MFLPRLRIKSRAKLRIGGRRLLNGTFRVLRGLVPWVDLPERRSPLTATYNHFQRWRYVGVWDHLMDAINQVQEGDVR